MRISSPVGIIDSGLGGLTVLEEIRAGMPWENLLYIADSAYAPYGNKEDVFIQQRALLLAEYLVETHAIKALVVACNTATAAAIHLLREKLCIPVIGMEPGIKPAVEVSYSGVIGILATENTLKSEKFSNLLDAHHHRARMLIQPCHGLVEAIESGDWSSDTTMQLLTTYIQPLLDAGADTLVLGCTHYPLLTPQIQAIAGENVQLINTAPAVARQLKCQLEIGQGKQQHAHPGITHCFTSQLSAHNQTMVARILGKAIAVQSLPEYLLNHADAG